MHVSAHVGVCTREQECARMSVGVPAGVSGSVQEYTCICAWTEICAKIERILVKIAVAMLTTTSLSAAVNYTNMTT